MSRAATLLRLAAAFGLAAFTWACFTTAGGDATETGNALTGKVVDGKGAPVAGARVMALSADYDPVQDAFETPKSTITDAQGRYVLRGLEPGQYNLFQRHDASGTSNLRAGVAVTGKPVPLPPDTLQRPGSLSVPVPESSLPGLAYIYIPGTLVQGRVTSDELGAGKLVLEDVPAGRLPQVVCRFNSDSDELYVIDEDLAVAPDQETSIPFTRLWKGVLAFRLNTSASGIDLRETLLDFPLAVRLRAPDLDFGRVLPGGEDLRFFKPDGTSLPTEVEMWDAARGEGLIWVRVDTLRPGVQNLRLMLHYANPTAQAASAPVFDTARGFAGVWHMDEEIPDTLAQLAYRDATPARHHADDRIGSQGRDGVLGRGHTIVDFDYLMVPSAPASLKPTSAFTLSAWVKSSLTTSGTPGEILSIGDACGLRAWGDGSVYAFFFPPGVPDSIVNLNESHYEFLNGGRPTLRDATWHLVSATLSGGTFRLFLDGRQIAQKAVPSTATVTYDRRLGKDFVIGKHGNGKSGYQFNGSLDEIQVHRVGRSSEWLRAVYENQKPGSVFPTPETP